MRILLFTNVYPTPWQPTKGTFNRDLVDGLRTSGDQVRVIVPVAWTDRMRNRRREIASDSETMTLIWWYPPRLRLAGRHRWMAGSLLARVVDDVRDWQPDLILAYWTHPDGTVALAIARRLGVPCVVMAGGSDLQVITSDPARRRVVAGTLCAADRVLTIGEALRAKAVALGVPSERVGAVQRGVNRDQFAPAPPREARARLDLPMDRTIALWVGRMERVKRLDLLFESWVQVVRDSTHNPLLLLVGDGSERSARERQAGPLRESVRFIGAVEHAALADWYRAADCVVLSSESEGVPNVLLEAMACGTPFVATAVGGVLTLHDDASRTVPTGNVSALAGALRDLLDVAPMSRRSQATVLDRAAAIAALRMELRRVVGLAPESAVGECAR